MYIITGYARITVTSAVNSFDIINDSLRAELTSRHKTIPSDSDFLILGTKLVSRIKGMLTCQLESLTAEEVKIIQNVVSDFKRGLSQNKRGFSKKYKLNQAVCRVSYRMHASEISDMRAEPTLKYPV